MSSMPVLTDRVDGERTDAEFPDGAIGADGTPETARRETTLERADRNLVELLQEVRVAQNGVQVLFGFLLALAFQTRFRETSSFQRVDYIVTLLAAGGSAVLLVTPTAYHRILFRKGDKEYLVDVANRVTIIGLTLMALAMVGVVLLITDFVFDSAAAATVAGCAAGGCLTLWFLLPLARRRELRRYRTPDSPPPMPAAGESEPPRLGSPGPIQP